jgi:hypothetical protein
LWTICTDPLMTNIGSAQIDPETRCGKALFGATSGMDPMTSAPIAENA